MNPSLILPASQLRDSPWFSFALEHLPIQFSLLHIYIYVYIEATIARNREINLLPARQPVVVLPLRAFFFPEFLPYSTDSLGSLPEREAFGVVAQVEVPSIENLPHVARVARVETYPRRVRWKVTGVYRLLIHRKFKCAQKCVKKTRKRGIQNIISIIFKKK